MDEHVRFERPDDRTLRIVRWFGGSEQGVNDVDLCWRGGVTPDESTCVVPNLPAKVVHAYEPETPWSAAFRAVNGIAYVVVSLDAASNVTGTRISRTPSETVNEPSLKAARLTTYRTQHRDCHPVPGEYMFGVSYQPY
jgi:hypothetical protein